MHTLCEVLKNFYMYVYLRKVSSILHSIQSRINQRMNTGLKVGYSKYERRKFLKECSTGYF